MGARGAGSAKREGAGMREAGGRGRGGLVTPEPENAIAACQPHPRAAMPRRPLWASATRDARR